MMNRLLIAFVIFVGISFSSFSQEIEISDSLQKELAKQDSVIMDSLFNTAAEEVLQKDSIYNDSLSLDIEQDTTQLIQGDSIPMDSVKLDSVSVDSMQIDSILIDTIPLDTILVDSIPVDTNYIDTAQVFSSYESFLRAYVDTIFDRPDTIQYIIHNIESALPLDTTLNDSIKQAVYKLVHNISGRNFDESLDYLKSRMELERDSVLVTKQDSIYSNIKYLVNSIPEDSLNVMFTNSKSDSVFFKSALNKKDSIRLNLYDNRSEYGVLWIKKKEGNFYDIALEDGIYLEKARQQKVVNQGFNVFGMPSLKPVKKVSKTIPIWTFDGSADVKVSQGYISDSWSEGGESSISALSIFKYSTDYNYGKIRNLDTDVEYRLGYIKAGENDLKKNDDKFEINAKYGKSAINNWYYSALLNFKTQLFKGKEYVNDSTVNIISEFLSPAYMVFSLGLDYKPSSKLTVLISPITSKFTIVADTVNYDQTRFGLAGDEFIRKEIGAYVKAISKIKLKNNINIENKINFFTNYMDNPQNIDVDWEIDLKVKLTDYINMSVNAHFIYDDDVAFIDKNGKERGARAQFKELFGVGFTYIF